MINGDVNSKQFVKKERWMTVAEYMASFLRGKGITKVFAIQGGGSARLIDAIGYTEGIEYICNQHEQASAMSADGCARASGQVGCAISTSGPGATNLLSGCSGAYFDSIPVLFITGQVSSFRLKGNLHVRCMHTQETEVVDIFKSITKYAVAIRNPYDIRYELEKCFHIATTGRPGPVLIDIPDDYQRTEIEVDKLKGFDQEVEDLQVLEEDWKQYFEKLVELVSESNRPVIIVGWGVHVSNTERDFLDFAETLGMPVVCTWGANDLMPEGCKLKVGTLGMNGSSSGNYAVCKADLVIIIGARLDHHTVIVPLNKFARRAKKVYIDIDEAEILKFKERGCVLDLAIHSDIRQFFLYAKRYMLKGNKDLKMWLKEIETVREKDKGMPPHTKDAIVDPFRFFSILSDRLEENALIFVDTGSSLVWTEQYLKVKKGQRIHSSLNNTPMGYALPAAIGAAVATKGRVYSINGDGGLQMNIQELATVMRHNLDIKIILFENAGYGMVQKTQDTYMGGRHEGTDISSGLAFPDFEKLFVVYGFDVTVIDKDDESDSKLQSAFKKIGPGCVIVKVSINEDYKTFHTDDIAE